MRNLSAFCVVLAVAGCGGGGTTVIPSNPPTGPQALLDYNNDFNQILSQSTQFNSSSAAAIAAETSNSVIFNGVMLLDAAPSTPSETYWGDASLDVNFSTPTGSLTGSATQFYFYDDSGPSQPGQAVAGTLTLDATSLTGGSAGTIPITIGGNLQLVGTSGTTLANGSASGLFVGNTPDLSDPNRTGNILWLNAPGSVNVGSQNFTVSIATQR